MRAAVGTSLVVIAINSITGLVGRLEDLPSIDWPVIAAFAVASMTGGLIGSRVSARTRPATLQAAFAILLATAAIATAMQAVPDLMGA